MHCSLCCSNGCGKPSVAITTKTLAPQGLARACGLTCAARSLRGTLQWLVVPKLWLPFWIASMEQAMPPCIHVPQALISWFAPLGYERAFCDLLPTQPVKLGLGGMGWQY